MSKLKTAVLGASGYTGADLIRLGYNHPDIEFTLLTANSHAGRDIGDVFPHLAGLGLPQLVKAEEANFTDVDVVFCGLPHGTTQEMISAIAKDAPDTKIVDMSADFRLRDPSTYAKWYGHEHRAIDLQPSAVYGLTEHYRDDIKRSNLIACPGCYPTAVLMALLPLAQAKMINCQDLIIDAKSGVSGAGRGLKQNTLFCEAGEGLSPYSVAGHRHVSEIEQEISRACGEDLLVNFTPHLIPMSRGELVTCYVRLNDGYSPAELRQQLKQTYQDELFISVVEEGVIPSTQQVRGSNFVRIGVFDDRVPGRAIIISTLDNLVKGSSGQALQNMNLMFGLEETTGLMQLPMFP